MRVLVTGASGLLGSSLCLVLLRAGHDVTGTYLTHGGPFPFSALRVDLRDANQVDILLAQVNPEVVIHCAALSRVIECERQPEVARQHNVEATELLATYAERGKAHFVFLSTDQVFNGGSGSHSESDLPKPTHVYGHTKSVGEQIVQEICSVNLIIRSNNIVGQNVGFGLSFTDGIVRKLLAGTHVALFHDQTRSPIHIRVMTEVIQRAVEDHLTGILHAGGPEQLSRYATGCRLADAYGISRDQISAVSLTTHPDSAFLHRDGTFDTSKLQSLYPDLGTQPIDHGFIMDAQVHKVKAHV